MIRCTLQSLDERMTRRIFSTRDTGGSREGVAPTAGGGSRKGAAEGAGRETRGGRAEGSSGSYSSVRSVGASQIRLVGGGASGQAAGRRPGPGRQSGERAAGADSAAERCGRGRREAWRRPAETSGGGRREAGRPACPELRRYAGKRVEDAPAQYQKKGEEKGSFVEAAWCERRVKM
ncbi:uncharacterized protein LOC120711382 [Panicum virgatum]|uniref:uncharacterized protein LOC120711382 n=1 Tax=Panicum virgatum TaxID=38727 RepID=UPI0019D5D7B9|nr:uncharacterized protein LOC120711382 [Panicum virgatum]